MVFHLLICEWKTIFNIRVQELPPRKGTSVHHLDTCLCARVHVCSLHEMQYCLHGYSQA